MHARLWQRAVVTGIGGGALSASIACSLLVDASRPQCAKDDDCAARGAAFAGAVCSAGLCAARPSVRADAGDDASAVEPGPWGCLGHVTGPPPTASDTPTVFRVVDATTLSAAGNLDDAFDRAQGIAGLTVKVCSGLDVDCTQPLEPPGTTDASGNVPLILPPAFAGYLDIQGEGYVRTMRFLSGTPVSRGKTRAAILARANAATLVGVVSGGTQTFDDRHAVLSVAVYDCARSSSRTEPGVVFTLDAVAPDTITYYVRDGVPSVSGAGTDAIGSGGFVNAPVGANRVHAIVPSRGGAEINSLSVFTRPGAMTLVTLEPP